jgi:pilus assembly protein Flp/PilA
MERRSDADRAGRSSLVAIARLAPNRGGRIIRKVFSMLYQPHESGQGLVEYALILVLVAIVVIVILAILGPTIGNVFSNIVNVL